ncbi:MAG: uroporphyrinogen decarboxylase (URO-D) [Oscillospiraceae bacterium]|nr:uroporphyrinogen decarboxylase (URO-D) [Oscillospiraceae bacterium]
MLTPKENLLETIKVGGHPDCLPNSYTPFQAIGGDPIFQFLRGNRIRGTTSHDRWGTLILFPEDAPAAVPLVTQENQVLPDITRWQEYVKVPDLVANCSEGWETAQQNAAAIDRDRYLSMIIMGTGIFEQLHFLMTFEDTLMNLLTEPEATHELIDVIMDFRLTHMRMVVEKLHPDIICSHDDWGSKNSLFMSPETWREFFKEPYRKLYKYLHDNGVMVMHHADSFLEPIVEDMAEIGVDIWQGVLPSNDIPAISKRLNGSMALMGGIDSVIDRADATEEEIRTETRRACNEYGELGHFIPCMTYGALGTIYPEVEPVIIDEVARYNVEHFGGTTEL